MGTPEFAVPALSALRQAGHDIAAVYTQPPKAAGRGQKPQKSPVQSYAEAHNIPVRTPKSLRAPEVQEEFAALRLDCAVVAAYGLLLPLPILRAPRLGCINIHASLLPRWRGAAPIHRAILAGDKLTGITIMLMDAGLDTGPMLSQQSVTIAPGATAGDLHDVLADMGADLIVETLRRYAAREIAAQQQPANGITYADKLKKSEGAIDWTQSATILELQVHGLQPWPGCFFRVNGEIVKLLRVEKTSGQGTPGTLLDMSGVVACGEDALRLLKVQRPGKAPVDGVDFLNGLRLRPGVQFDHGAL
ncbi:MAG: methionyl-tRNA formyltransferase [Alphaproteobacteria bacterium]